MFIIAFKFKYLCYGLQETYIDASLSSSEGAQQNRSVAPLVLCLHMFQLFSCVNTGCRLDFTAISVLELAVLHSS